MYKIDIEPVEKPKSRANDLLFTMMDVLENIEHVDDAGYVHLSDNHLIGFEPSVYLRI